jgi:hypothetical protein
MRDAKRADARCEARRSAMRSATRSAPSSNVFQEGRRDAGRDDIRLA